MPYVSITRTTSILHLFCGVVLLLGTTVHGAEMLTLDEAIMSTVTRNPDLLAFGYEMRVQDSRILQAGLAPKPELTIAVEDVLGTGVAQGVSGAQTTVSIAWVVEGDLRQRRIDTARTGSLLLAAEAEVMRLDAAAQTARYYTDALAHQARLEVAEQAVALAEDTIDTVAQRVNAASSLASELAMAQAELARRELHLEDLQHELTGYYHRIAAQWGDLTLQFSRVEGDLLQLPRIDSYAVLQTRIEQNPSLQRFLSEQRLHESTLQLEQARRRTPWRFNAGVRRIESSSDTGFIAGVTIALDRGNQNQGRIEEARARLAQSAAQQEATRVRIQTTLLLFHQELEHALHVAESLRTLVIPRYEEALLQVRRAYELGSTRYLEWLQVQGELLNAREELLEASILAHRNLIEIERLTGVRVAPDAFPAPSSSPVSR